MLVYKYVLIFLRDGGRLSDDFNVVGNTLSSIEIMVWVKKTH